MHMADLDMAVPDIAQEESNMVLQRGCITIFRGSEKGFSERIIPSSWVSPMSTHAKYGSFSGHR